jgi:hypothetical protein
MKTKFLEKQMRKSLIEKMEDYIEEPDKFNEVILKFLQ